MKFINSYINLCLFLGVNQDLMALIVNFLVLRVSMETIVNNHGANCSKIDGSCTCPTGWTGKNCDLKCTEGFYGVNCMLECRCSKNGICDRFTGECECFGEYQGIHCDESKIFVYIFPCL